MLAAAVPAVAIDRPCELQPERPEKVLRGAMQPELSAFFAETELQRGVRPKLLGHQPAQEEPCRPQHVARSRVPRQLVMVETLGSRIENELRRVV